MQQNWIAQGVASKVNNFIAQKTKNRILSQSLISIEFQKWSDSKVYILLAVLDCAPQVWSY